MAIPYECPRCHQRWPIQFSGGQVCPNCENERGWSERIRINSNGKENPKSQNGAFRTDHLQNPVILVFPFLGAAFAIFSLITFLVIHFDSNLSNTQLDPTPWQALDFWNLSLFFAVVLGIAGFSAVILGGRLFQGSIDLTIPWVRLAYTASFVVTLAATIAASGYSLFVDSTPRVEQFITKPEARYAATVLVMRPTQSRFKFATGTGIMVQSDTSGLGVLTYWESRDHKPTLSKEPGSPWAVWIRTYDSDSSAEVIWIKHIGNGGFLAFLRFVDPLGLPLTTNLLPELPLHLKGDPEKETIKGVKVFYLAAATVIGQTVRSVPNPGHGRWYTREGVVVSRMKKLAGKEKHTILYTTLPFRQEDQGSGVFDSSNRLIGILLDTDKETGISRVLCLGAAEKFGLRTDRTPPQQMD